MPSAVASEMIIDMAENGASNDTSKGMLGEEEEEEEGPLYEEIDALRTVEVPNEDDFDTKM